MADSGPGAPDGSDLPDGGGGGPDAGVDGCEGLLPFVPSNFGCDVGEVGEALVLDDDDSPYVFDTSSGMLTRPDGSSEAIAGVTFEQEQAPDIYVVARSSFLIATGVRLDVDGALALALVTTGDLTVNGLLDVGATAEESGPGGDDSGACADGRGGLGQAQDFLGVVGGSGGGGGAFAAAGGAGAPVQGISDEETAGGDAHGSPELVPLRGGCAGGEGGVASANGGRRGAGGGGLQLVAGGTIRIGGIVTARGAGGGGINSEVDGGGGGGGGSGGGLLLEAMQIQVDGAVTANGGGGGEGTRTNNSTVVGTDGSDNDDARAPGGEGTPNGGNGGAGGAAAGENGQNGQEGDSDLTFPIRLAGGGGGGGSAGRIRLRAVATGAPSLGGQAVVSPAAR